MRQVVLLEPGFAPGQAAHGPLLLTAYLTFPRSLPTMNMNIDCNWGNKTSSPCYIALFLLGSQLLSCWGESLCEASKVSDHPLPNTTRSGAAVEGRQGQGQQQRENKVRNCRGTGNLTIYTVFLTLPHSGIIPPALSQMRFWFCYDPGVRMLKPIT